MGDERDDPLYKAVMRPRSKPAMTLDKQAVEKAARAIEGPHLPVHAGSKFSLEHLREVRWSRLSEQERGEREAEARAAIAALVPQEEEVGRMVREAVENALLAADIAGETYGAKATRITNAVLERFVGIQGK